MSQENGTPPTPEAVAREEIAALRKRLDAEMDRVFEMWERRLDKLSKRLDEAIETVKRDMERAR